MGRLSKDHWLFRGAAAALLVATASPPARAQVAGTIRVRPTRDSIVVRRLEADRVKIDSVMVLMRALDAEPALSEQAARMRRELEGMLRTLTVVGPGSGGGLMFRGGPAEVRMVESQRLKGWIGINSGLVPFTRHVDSTGDFVHYYRYPIIISVEPDSPAQRAGIAQGDTLIAYDGQDVVRTRVNMRELMIPEKKLNVTVRRDGEARDFTLVVAKPPERIAMRWRQSGDMPMPMTVEGRAVVAARSFPGGASAGEVRRFSASDRAVFVEVGPGGYVVDRANFMNRGGVFGAGLVTLGPELARVFKLDRTGVLVQEAPAETPAFKAGMRVGDVIVSVAGHPVNTIADVQSIVMSRVSQGGVAVQLLRDNKPVVVNVKW